MPDVISDTNGKLCVGSYHMWRLLSNPDNYSFLSFHHQRVVSFSSSLQIDPCISFDIRGTAFQNFSFELTLLFITFTYATTCK